MAHILIDTDVLLDLFSTGNLTLTMRQEFYPYANQSKLQDI